MSGQKRLAALVSSGAPMRVLRDMLAAEDRDDLLGAEIVQDGRECWVGLRRTSVSTVNRLLLLGVLRHDRDGGCDHYTMNEEGRRLARDPSYVPAMVPHLTAQPTADGLRPLLVQELVPDDLHYPWRVIASCALLNRTQGAQVRPVLVGLFRDVWPSPESVFRASAREVLEPLGLYGRREALLRRMTWDYLAGAQPDDCHGVGAYGRDAVALFVRGERPDPGSVSDRWLAPYAEWRARGGRRVGWDVAGHSAWRKAQGFAPLRPGVAPGD